MFLNDSVEESTYKTVECETKSDDCIIDSRGTMVRTFMCRSNTNSAEVLDNSLEICLLTSK